jgi:hypothetical protein
VKSQICCYRLPETPPMNAARWADAKQRSGIRDHTGSSGRAAEVSGLLVPGRQLCDLPRGVVGDAGENGGEVKLRIETVERTDGRYRGASRDRCELSAGFPPNAGGERAVEEGDGRVRERGI